MLHEKTQKYVVVQNNSRFNVLTVLWFRIWAVHSREDSSVFHSD